MKKRTVTYDPTGINNFHNSPSVRVRVGKEAWDGDETVYAISPSVGRRLLRHFCGIKDCSCPAGGIMELSQDHDGKPTAYGLPTQFIQ